MKELNKIKELLIKHNKTQSWLSDKIGVSRNSISKWCNNEVQPNLSDLDSIAIALNIDILTLIQPSQLNKNMITEYNLRFLKPYYIPPTIDGIQFYFPYIINEKLLYGVQMSISGTLAIGWGFPIWQNQNADEFYKLLIRALFQEAIKYLEMKILNRELKEIETHMLLTTNAPNRMPYNPDDLKDPENQIIQIKVKKNKISFIPYITEHCKFYLFTGEILYGFMSIDEFEKYYIITNQNLSAYQELRNNPEKNLEEMKKLRFYVDASEILNIEPLKPKK